MHRLVVAPRETLVMPKRWMLNVARLVGFGVLCLALYSGQETLAEVFDPDVLRSTDRAWSPGWIGGYLLFWCVANSVLWPTLAGGVLFGWVGGMAMTLVGATLAATVQLLLYRSLLRAPVQDWFGHRIAPVQDALERDGFAYLVIWRLLWLPIWMITMAAALTKFPLWKHLASIPVMIPMMLVITWMADGLVVHGLAQLPLERWLALGGAFGISVGAWAIARQRWPALQVGTPSGGR